MARGGKARPHPVPLLQGEGGSSAAVLIIRATVLAEHSTANPETDDGYSFSQGEKGRLRASQIGALRML
jgi:hypothetical protein